METLILSGGGSKGSFQAGVLYQLFDIFKFKEIKGTSVGALNSVILAQCYLDNSAELLKKIWTEIIKKNDDVYNVNYLKSIILNQPYSFSPLEKIIDKYINIDSILKMPIEISMTSTDLITGNSVYITNKNSSKDVFKKGIIASATIPPAFPPVETGNYMLVDGGLRENVPLKDIIKRKENILVIINSPIKMDIVENKNNLNLISVGTRAIDIMMNEITTNDINSIISIKEDQIKNKEKEKINIDIIAPYENVMESSLDFNNNLLNKNFNNGRLRATKYIQDVWGKEDKFYIKDAN